MSIVQRVTTWAVVVAAAALLAMSWITTALAPTTGDDDGFDGDELGLPIALGSGVIALVTWLAFRGRSSKSPN